MSENELSMFKNLIKYSYSTQYEKSRSDLRLSV